ncbi:MAG: hypothetical protein ACLFMX_07040 [Halobacteriales archaeon]
MRLDEILDDFERDEAADRRRLARERSYGITRYLEDVEARFETVVGDDTAFGSTAPEIFVGRFGYPEVSAGVLSPVGREDEAERFRTDARWYREGLGIADVVERRTSLLNARDRVDVHVADVWDGTVGAQREVAIADRPVDVEVTLADRPAFTLDAEGERVPPIGPRAGVRSVALGENPHVPRAVETVIGDDDWKATGAMTWLYRRGFDVYDIDSILSAGALGEAANRRLVPTRWSITAVDDTIGQYLRGRVANQPSIDETRIYASEYIGNRYWIVITPGRWEYELVEMKGPGSVWNPDQGTHWIGSAHEGAEGRRGYVEETAGAYYAARLGVLEALEAERRQAKALVLREVTDDYWAPVGVWQVREAVRDAMRAGPIATPEDFGTAAAAVLDRLPLPAERIRRKSTLLTGRQAALGDFTA